MSRIEFAEIMAYIEAGCGVSFPKESSAVYWDLLSDLPLASLQYAARRTVLEHKYHTFPPVGMIRGFALCQQQPTAGEAWQMVWRAAGAIDLEIQGPYRHYRGDGGYDEYASQAEMVLQGLPPLVLKAMRCYGLTSLCDADKVEVARAQFERIYKDLAERERQDALLPGPMKEKVEKIRAATVEQIGRMPD